MRPTSPPAESAPREIGAVVLCGGRSTRMGRDKASLPFGPGQTLLSHTLERVQAGLAAPVVCVAAVGQPLPALPAGVEVARDAAPGLGPLAALATGLAALAGRADVALAVGCDTPLLAPGWAGALAALLGDHDAALPVEGDAEGDAAHPLAALYRTRLAGVAARMLAAGERRLAALAEGVDTVRVPVDRLRRVDPELWTLLNCNDPAAYARALAVASTSPSSSGRTP